MSHDILGVIVLVCQLRHKGGGLVKRELQSKILARLSIDTCCPIASKTSYSKHSTVTYDKKSMH